MTQSRSALNTADDIAIRLRSHETDGVTSSDRYHLRNEAAAEIDRLRKEVKTLEERLYDYRKKAGEILPPGCTSW